MAAALCLAKGALMNCRSPRSSETLARAIAREYRASPQGRLRPIVTSAALVAALGLAAAPCALAGNTYVVTTTTNSSITGSLRWAVDQANMTTGNTVRFDDSLKGSTITLTTGITISKPMTITGPGTHLLTISGGFQSRIFYANTKPTAAYVTISDMTFIAGNVGGYSGGAVACSHCLLKLVNMDINASSAYSGGGVFAYDADLFVSQSRISANNASQSGGGIAVKASHATIIDSTISGNTAGEYGAGIYVADASGSSQSFAISRSTVNANTIPIPNGQTTTGGAGIAFRNAGANIFVYDSTIAQNYAYGNGAGIALLDAFSAMNVIVQSSTIAANLTSSSLGNGISAFGTNAVTVQDSIVSGNFNPGGISDLQGTFKLYRSLVQNSDSATLNVSTGNIFGVDPKLGALGDHGGLTRTMVPAANSLVIDAATAACSPGQKDQRGYSRCVNAKNDMGAVERQNPEPIIFRDGFNSG